MRQRRPSRPTISESHVLKRDPLFQLQRVATDDGTRLLVKFAVSDVQGVGDTLLEHEFRVFEQLPSKHMLAPVQLVAGDRLTAEYRDVNCQPLGPQPTGTTLRRILASVARDLCSLLAHFHDNGWLLLGMSPGSFLLDIGTESLLLADAPFARQLKSSSHPTQEYLLHSPYLPYAAPEVVGHVPLQVDFRADLYSLGAVLYHLSCGHAPFATTDVSELVHCHLAREPRPLSDHAPSISRPAADLVMNLLAKNPLDRFASLPAFEEAFLHALSADAGHASVSSPRLGRERSLQLSTRLYGLEGATARLREKLSRTRSTPAITFVEGDAGVGKTSLLTHARSLLGHGYFCRGRFLSTGAAEPLSGWASALADLASILLTKNSADTGRWQERILSELGDGAGLVAQLVPEWAAILPTAPRPGEALADGALNRLAVAIHTLLRCYAGPDTPVVLVLDDIHWADDSSLRILELVLRLPEPLNLLVVCGVRSSADPRSRTPKIASLREELASAGVDVQVLPLGAWDAEQLRAFLRDTFEEGLSREEELADFLMVRTQGNPFFVQKLLRTAVDQHLFAFDSASRSWTYAQDALQMLPPADSVVAFLTRKILGLSSELKQTLRIAACLGPRFSFSDFSLASGESLVIASASLELAVIEGLLLFEAEGEAPAHGPSTNPNRYYAFTHDRVLEACRGMLGDDEHASLCLRIGRTLLAIHSPNPPGEIAHRLAGYFNAARSLISSDTERPATAQLNLEAGAFARQSGAFSQALDHFLAGLAFLEDAGTTDPADRYERAWFAFPDLTLALFEAAAEAALLNGALQVMHAFCDTVLAHARSPLQKARTYEIRVSGLNAEKRFAEAVTAACDILAQVGVRFPRHPSTLRTIAAYLTTKRGIFRAPLHRLTELGTNKDATAKAAFRIMQVMYSSAYFGHPQLFPLVVCRHIDASLRHGNEDYSCVTYVAFAIVLCARGDFANAARLGGVALELMRRPGGEMHAAKVILGHYAFVHPWLHHLRDCLPYLADGARIGIHHGDFEYAGHLLTTQSLARLHCGFSLQELVTEFDQRRTTIASLRQERSIILQELLCQMIHDLRSGSSGGSSLAGPFYVEQQMLPRCLEPLDQNLAFHHFMAKMMLELLCGDKANALAAAQQAREFFDGGAFGFYIGPIFVFWEALLYAWKARKDLKGRRSALRRTAKASRLLRRWAAAAPMNFLHKFHLLEAERHRLRGRHDEAALQYERAIELAQAHGYVQDAALAQECAAEFYLDREMERLGRQYLRDCYATYARWGAPAVTARLERVYPQHFAVFVSNMESPDSGARPRLSENLDYRALLQASQAISGEVQLPNLLKRLLRTMFEHAGAQRALLILERRGQLNVVAEADVDQGSVALVQADVDSARVFRSVVRYVAATAKPMALGDASEDERFNRDPYVLERRPRSVLCVPIVHQGKLLGLAYLENNRVSHVFTDARVEIAGLLAGQAGISIAGARLHALELEAQQAKIKPHFLFNVLSSIADLAVEDGHHAEDAVLKLAHIYRYILATSQESPVTLGRELEVVRKYLDLEKLRFGSKLEFVITCDETVSQVPVPGLLVEPLVENAIRHGIAPKLSPGCVWVHAFQVCDRCHIVVQDDGDGGNHGTAGTGFGLRSVQERLGLVFGRDFGISITRRGGYRVELEVPMGGAPDAFMPPALSEPASS